VYIVAVFSPRSDRRKCQKLLTKGHDSCTLFITEKKQEFCRSTKKEQEVFERLCKNCEEKTFFKKMFRFDYAVRVVVAAAASFHNIIPFFIFSFSCNTHSPESQNR
jgi:hypothetical protein